MNTFTRPFLIFVLTILTFPTAIYAQSDTLTFTQVSEYQTFPNLPQTTVPDQMDRPYLYVAAKEGGLITFDVSDIQIPVPVDTPDLSVLGDLHVMDAFQVGNFLYLAMGNFFGSNPQAAGIAIVDVTMPDHGLLRGYWMTNMPLKGSAIVRVEGDYAYLGAMNQGVYIFDVSDKDMVVYVGQSIPDKDFPLPNPSASQEPNARGMAIQDSLLYLCYDAGGLRVINIADKANPVEISKYINEGALNTQQAYNNILLNGNVAYVAMDYCGMEVLDISNPDSIKQIGWWNPWECEGPGNVWFNSPGHTNQMVHLELDSIILMSAGGSELVAVNISDPANPFQIGTFGMPGNQLAVWGVSAHDRHVFLTYINALVPFFSTWSGIKILSIDQMATDIEVEEMLIEGLTVFPNPFSDAVQIEVNLVKPSDVILEIFDVQGRCIFRNSRFFPNKGQNVLTIQLPDTPEGMYLGRIKIGEEMRTFRLVKTP